MNMEVKIRNLTGQASPDTYTLCGFSTVGGEVHGVLLNEKTGTFFTKSVYNIEKVAAVEPAEHEPVKVEAVEPAEPVKAETVEPKKAAPKRTAKKVAAEEAKK